MGALRAMWNFISGRASARAAEQAAVSAMLRAERQKTVSQIADIEEQASLLSGSDALMMRHLEKTMELASRNKKRRP